MPLQGTLHLNATVPTGWTVVSNGVRKPVHKGLHAWVEEVPITPSATMIAIDRFTVRESTLPAGTTVLDAFATGANTTLDPSRTRARLRAAASSDVENI